MSKEQNDERSAATGDAMKYCRRITNNVLRHYNKNFYLRTYV
ncbi:MAG TPA: hypothetical protein VF487_19855 [Chitinophagaceae bacterium]